MNSKPTLDPSIITIAGITGNLSKKYLLPALYDLIANGMVPENFRIVGLSRKDVNVQDLVQLVKDDLTKKDKQPDDEAMNKMEQILRICIMDISKAEDYKILRETLDKIEDETNSCMHRLYYLAIPAQIFEPVIDGLGTFGLNNGCQHGGAESRLLLEKPFGFDLSSAHKLIEKTGKSFSEEQIYRVDHYLAKQNAQNILTFRFQNPLFDSVWDNKHIDYITVTAAEEIGIEMRANFYDQTGALRDYIQSHLLQLLAIATMDEPRDDSVQSLHEAKHDLLKSIEPITKDQVETNVVRGQYEGYKSEVNNQLSKTETFVALKLEINNDRWQGVPILLRTGKKLEERITEINFKFKDSKTKNHPPSIMTIRIQPNEGIVLSLVAKKPGFNDEMQIAQMQFCYDQHFDEALPNAYEYVLVDALRGDQSLFPSAEEVIRSWEILENIIQSWFNGEKGPEIYPIGSWGPKSSEELAKNAGATWKTHQLRIC